MPLDPVSGVYYEVHGSGEPLLLGFPLMASHAEIFGDEAAAVKDGFLAGLTDAWRVLLLDYPNIGRSRETRPEDLTAEQVCRDLLAVADAAGFSRFAYWGYSWGANAGLQLATRTDRLTALVIGGWPPVGAQYADLLAAAEEQMADPPASSHMVLRSPAQYAQWVHYGRSMAGWDEGQALVRIRCPRLVYAGGEGDVYAGRHLLRNASMLRARRQELEAAGWQVLLIEGRDHALGLDPAAVVPPVRAFLDAELHHGH